MQLCLPAAGNKSSVFGGQGAEEAVVALSHQVHDVVPAARGTKDHQRRIRAGNLNDKIVFSALLTFKLKFGQVFWCLRERGSR